MLLTGIPKVTFTGNTPADELRINLAVPVTPADKVSRLGVLGGDNQGWPNGRRLNDDVIDIAEQAVAGFLLGQRSCRSATASTRATRARWARSPTSPTRRAAQTTRTEQQH